MEKKQGTLANSNGKVVETMLLPLFTKNGFEVLSYKDYSKLTAESRPPKYVIKEVPFTTIYNAPGRTEFVIVDTTQNRTIRIESKYQATAGSVDEKYPYMFLNAVEQYPEKEIILIVDGDGYKAGAREWLERKINENWLDFKGKGKTIKLMKIIEFINWFNHEF
ncbi:PD-(D/E)XK nuclease superfamily protein [Succinivibrio dextrinosolvens]|jgi:hypothetical protein|uniref:PD-(D/E)XK nuclease superfamily protein n=1 Tax=Succinivibrio dextrinosolvens TaxID=83771 RepID=UPI00241E10B3|nr:PD-(D/E)XK nuclease superfamily protein [Succinivibrio dextrinosolvens]MBE6423073.1 4-diphosphocytidyl-2C-methyl-D-erythritol kinase [Succinivibrio dextrinosolvens]